MKYKALILSIALATSLFVGCGAEVKEDMPTPDPVPNQSEVQPDVVTEPSKVINSETLDTAVKESWIVILEDDVTTNNEIVLEGGFKKADKDDSTMMVEAPRVLTMYKSDENKEIIDTYTLTTPKVILKGDKSKVEGGTLKGDLYVEANDVVLEACTVDGNIYFKNQEAKDTFIMDEASKVTGEMKVQ